MARCVQTKVLGVFASPKIEKKGSTFCVCLKCSFYKV